MSYLQAGSPRQRECYRLLRENRIMEILEPYDPVLTGTIPIGIDVADSDLDIVCEVHDTVRFMERVRRHFGTYEGFSLHDNGNGVVVCGFFAGGEQVEIYASPEPSVRSSAYRHMMVEYRLLSLFGERFMQRVVELKRKGLKTEPAFARLLKVTGDPFAAVLELENRTDEELAALFKASPRCG